MSGAHLPTSRPARALLADVSKYRENSGCACRTNRRYARTVAGSRSRRSPSRSGYSARPAGRAMQGERAAAGRREFIGHVIQTRRRWWSRRSISDRRCQSGYRRRGCVRHGRKAWSLGSGLGNRGSAGHWGRDPLASPPRFEPGGRTSRRRLHARLARGVAPRSVAAAGCGRAARRLRGRAAGRAGRLGRLPGPAR